MTEQYGRIYRIGIDARFYQKDTGGIGRYTRHLLEELALIDPHNQYTVFLNKAGMAEWNINQPNFKAVEADIGYYTAAEQIKFLRILDKEKFDLVHFLNFNHPLFYMRPFVTTVHDLTVYFQPVGRSQRSFTRRQAFLAVLKHSVQAAKRVIAVSEATAQDVEKHLGASQAKIEVIYHGSPAPIEFPFGNKAMVQEYIGSRAPYFLFVSQWRPHKGILTLLEAFRKFKEETGLPHTLVLIGKQKFLEEEVKTALAESPVGEDILTPGFAPEEMLPLLYHNAVACLVPSEYEGFGLPVLEAFVHGTPVIAAENSSLPEVAGSAALMFPTKDAGALAERMKEIVTNRELAESLVQAGFSRSRQFSWAKAAEQTLKVYLNVLEKKVPSGMVSGVPRWRNR